MNLVKADLSFILFINNKKYSSYFYRVNYLDSKLEVASFGDVANPFESLVARLFCDF